ncbi:MAG: thioredoxin fold domain-containing protein [Rhodospirillaceae bacterium]|nr:thioredoxin fold domain-containing protein [Rhodospirillaceae bacterium]
MMTACFQFICLIVSLLMFAPAAHASEQSGEFLTPDGLHTEPWFNKTTGDLSRDLKAATAEGKKLVIFWEQLGCTYCEKMHEINLKAEGTVHFIRKNFYVVQLNMRGKRQMTDFDGATMSEAKLAHAHRVGGTPTIEFRDNQADEVFRMPGYAEPMIFLGVFDYVANSGYDDSPLVPWLKAKYLGNQQSGGS